LSAATVSFFLLVVHDARIRAHVFGVGRAMTEHGTGKGGRWQRSETTFVCVHDG